MNETPLNTFRFPENSCIAQAQPKDKGSVTLESPALEVMTDLAQVRAAMIEPQTLLNKAEKTMIEQGVRSLFVVRNFPCVEGLVTAADLIGEKPTQIVNQRRIRRQDLCVSDVMTELCMLDSLDYDELKTARLSRLIATFRKLGRTHLLVIQASTTQGPARIRGVISMTQIERQLGRSIL